jgi:hypothetical protein
MTGLRGSAQHTLATPARLRVRPIALALATLLVTAIVALAIVLVASAGDGQSSATGSVEATHSAPTAGDVQRSQPPGVNGPGARP